MFWKHYFAMQLHAKWKKKKHDSLLDLWLLLILCHVLIYFEPFQSSTYSIAFYHNILSRKPRIMIRIVLTIHSLHIYMVSVHSFYNWE